MGKKIFVRFSAFCKCENNPVDITILTKYSFRVFLPFGRRFFLDSKLNYFVNATRVFRQGREAD